MLSSTTQQPGENGIRANSIGTQSRLAIGIRIAAIPRSDEVKAWRNSDGADSCPFKSKKNAAWIKGTITIVTTHTINAAKDANTAPMADQISANRPKIAPKKCPLGSIRDRGQSC